jgi:hypothetical protein
VNRSTSWRMSEAMLASSLIARPASASPALVWAAAAATPETVAAISREPAAALATLLLMSFVVAAWSRTAVAMPPWYWLISSMTDEIRPIAPIASELSAWIASILRAT